MPEYRRGHAPRRTALALPPRRQRFALAVTALASVMTLLVAATAWALTSYVNGSLGRVDAGTSGTPASGPVNILVVGIDTRGGLTQKQEAALHVGNSISDNTDTMMLVHIPADHDHIQVVSIPRDSWVDIPGRGMNKINAADAFGGPRLMVRTVEHATGVVINDYVEINFLGFVKVVNALGGVNICLPFAVDDHYSGLHLSAGRHHVNGRVALEFVRDRHSFALSDIARIQDQQQLLSSMLSKATHVGLLANPIRLQAFVSSVSAAVTVDQGFNLIRLADELRGIRPSDVTFRTVPLATISYLTPTGQDAVLWNKTQAAALFRWLNQDTGAAPPRSTHHAARSKAGSKGTAGSKGAAGKDRRHRRRAGGKAGSGGASTAPGPQHTAAQDACH
jgi:LCP family protein required for cell wall assembly